MASPKFNVGEKVFAKIKGYAPWPARVNGITDLTPGRITYAVYFYGTKQFGICKERDIYLYSSNKDKYGKPKKRNRKFNESIYEADNDNNNETSRESSNLENDPDQINSSRPVQADHSPRKLNSSSVDIDCENTSDTDKIVSSMQTERMLIGLLLGIQKSLGTNHSNYTDCLKILEKIETVEMNKLMVLKNPEIVDTLCKVKNYNRANFGRKKTDLEMREEAQVKVKAQVLLSTIQSLFPCPYKQTFLSVFQEEVDRFQHMTRNLTQEEKYMLTEDVIKLSVENPEVGLSFSQQTI